ncbi:hypothetical protein [Kitasatospora kifunensis]|uniref:Uncharacterized protein n=1 Tax=Kitasatospora kifunensis TaxID=58351 RepID=A0A7W7W0Y0_KITKI|nr:hypothetical protein [Kitasatospora kifunensis]MBB4929115.1 hypothetical protein [Kitasatospora kifunensis]
MALLRRGRPKPDSYAIADIASLTGLHRSRISQLHQAENPDSLPEPDGADSTPTRPRWASETIARWCARVGRRLDPEAASWLMPGPDGPHLRRADERVVRLDPDPSAGALGRFAPQPLALHVAHYAPTGGNGSSIWLVTPLAPTETIHLLGWPPRWPHGHPLAHLVHEILADHDAPLPRRGDALLGTLVLLPTTAKPDHHPLAAEARLLDLYSSDVEQPGRLRGDVHDRLRISHRQGDGELFDLVQAIGHRLPLWHAGCATAELTATWEPERTGRLVPGRIPPPLAPAWSFRQRCEAVARTADGALAESLRQLGGWRWDTASCDWHSGPFGYLDLPEGCDARIWQRPVDFELPPRQRVNGDFWQALEWLMEESPSRILAEAAADFYTDPGSAGIAVVDPHLLPLLARDHLTRDITPVRESVTSYRARRVVEFFENAGLPDVAGGATLGRWPLPGGPAWCATADGTALVAVHVPRRTPAPHEPVTAPVDLDGAGAPAGPGERMVGQPLEVVFVPTATPEMFVGFLLTDSDQTLLLPALGGAEALASAVEHVVWHPGERALPVGLPRSGSRALVNAISARLPHGPSTAWWQQITQLVGEHDERHCHYCSRRAARPEATAGPSPSTA